MFFRLSDLKRYGCHITPLKATTGSLPKVLCEVELPSGESFQMKIKKALVSNDFVIFKIEPKFVKKFYGFAFRRMFKGFDFIIMFIRLIMTTVFTFFAFGFFAASLSFLKDSQGKALLAFIISNSTFFLARHSTEFVEACYYLTKDKIEYFREKKANK